MICKGTVLNEEIISGSAWYWSRPETSLGACDVLPLASFRPAGCDPLSKLQIFSNLEGLYLVPQSFASVGRPEGQCDCHVSMPKTSETDTLHPSPTMGWSLEA